MSVPIYTRSAKIDLSIPTMPNTKSKILTAALDLFNKRGFKDTTLQIIADEVGISVGNLAYHYKNKPDILSAHTEILDSKLRESLTHFRNFPNFLDFHIQLQHILAVQEEFSYIFRNQGEIAIYYPETFQLIQDFRQKLKTQIESRIEYQAEKGHLHIKTEEELNLLTNSLTHFILSSQLHQLYELEKDEKRLFRELWALIKVYLSEQGLKEYQILIHSSI